jgi:hypothetical protein
MFRYSNRNYWISQYGNKALIRLDFTFCTIFATSISFGWPRSIPLLRQTSDVSCVHVLNLLSQNPDEILEPLKNAMNFNVNVKFIILSLNNGWLWMANKYPLDNDLVKMIDWFIVLNATFSNISAISWRSVLVVEEAGVSGENHRQATGKRYHLRLRVECTLFCNLQSWARTHAVLVIARLVWVVW